MNRIVLPLLVLAAITLTMVGSVCAESPDFSSWWHDGNAEIDGYRLTVSRYGEERKGTCVMIYVTEPFSESRRVKVDDVAENPADTFDALKLNLIRDFQTGIYDYNTMVSVFVKSEDFSPSKITFSSAEWCGHVYDELVFRKDKVTGYLASYFEGETTSHEIAAKPDGVAEDNLFILLRSLRGEFLAPGEKRTVDYLPGVFYQRLAHEKPAWTTADIEHQAGTTSLEVPGGRFETTIYVVSVADGRTGTFYIEKDYPHRIVRWEMTPDVIGVLTGSERLAYWRLNQNGNENYLERLGL